MQLLRVCRACAARARFRGAEREREKTQIPRILYTGRKPIICARARASANGNDNSGRRIILKREAQRETARAILARYKEEARVVRKNERQKEGESRGST